MLKQTWTYTQVYNLVWGKTASSWHRALDLTPDLIKKVKEQKNKLYAHNPNLPIDKTVLSWAKNQQKTKELVLVTGASKETSKMILLMLSHLGLEVVCWFGCQKETKIWWENLKSLKKDCLLIDDMSHIRKQARDLGFKAIRPQAIKKPTRQEWA